MIEDVREDADRTGVQRFLQGLLPDIAHNAVPMSASDGMYAPVVVRAVRDDGQIVGAALSCRAQVAAMASAMPGERYRGWATSGRSWTCTASSTCWRSLRRPAGRASARR